jgi:ABC-2 type transport system ATP-binding protein
MNVLEASGLGKRYGSTWAVRDCRLAIPGGHVAVGLAAPSAGVVTVLGGRPAGSPAALDGIAFVAQDTPLYKTLSVADMVHLTRNLNRCFDQRYAHARLGELGIPLKRRAGKLSGGQQAQLALTLALARRPRLLVLDEPVAMLDPIARHDFMATVLAAAADDGVSVLLSSHVLAELERVADYLILMSRGRVQMAGEVDDLLASHRLLTGRAAEAGRYDRLGGAPGRPGGTRPGLPARARRRGAARTSPRPQRRADGGEQMTALTVPARPEEDLSLRPVPWRQMAWVTWRQHRTMLAGVAVVLGGLAVTLLIPGLRLHHAFAAAAACRPVTSLACNDLVSTFNGMNGFPANGYVLQAVPALIGAFAGAPVLARELETGTFRYAWTQGFGRWRWTLAKLVPLAVMVAVAAGALSLLSAWYYQPYFAANNLNLGLASTPALDSGTFGIHGIAFAAWTLAAFAIGALAGMLIRRVVPAIAATLVVYVGLGVATALYLRPHYLTPVLTRNVFLPPASASYVSQWWTKGGRRQSPLAMTRIYDQLVPGVNSKAQKVHEFYQVVPRYLTQHGYTEWTRYQPGSRFWPFQAIEGGWLLVLLALLIAATVWLVRRRAA